MPKKTQKQKVNETLEEEESSTEVEQTVKVVVKAPNNRVPHTLHELVTRKIFAEFHDINYKLEDYQKVIWSCFFKVRTYRLWACMTYKGVGEIIQFEVGDLTDWKVKSEACKDYYNRALVKSIGGTLRSQKLKRSDCIIQTDPVLYNESIFEWRHKEEFKKLMFGWPCNSMDMYPMRPIIKIFKHKLHDLCEAEPDLDEVELWKKTENLWKSIPVEAVQESINKMPERMKAVIVSKGHHIRYI